MTGPTNTPAAPDARETWEDRLAGPMFFLSLVFLFSLAGLIHRFKQLELNDPESFLILGTLGVLWLVLLLEAVFRFRLRDTDKPVWKPLAGLTACALVPPLRLTWPSQVRPRHVWLPGLGWRHIDNHLRQTLERFFSIPMILFALLVLPLFLLEFYWQEWLETDPWLKLVLALGTGVIWLAFAIELIVMASVADKPWRYCLSHWIDVAIVILPAFEMLPLFRLLRLGRVLRLEELLRWGRLHRLQAVAMRGWRALMLLQIVQRLLGRSPEHHLRQLHELLQAKEEEVADLRQEIREVEARIARKAAGARTALVAPDEPAPHIEPA